MNTCLSLRTEFLITLKYNQMRIFERPTPTARGWSNRADKLDGEAEAPHLPRNLSRIRGHISSAITSVGRIIPAGQARNMKENLGVPPSGGPI